MAENLIASRVPCPRAAAEALDPREKCVIRLVADSCSSTDSRTIPLTDDLGIRRAAANQESNTARCERNGANHG